MRWSQDLRVRQVLAETVRRSYIRIWDSCVTGYIKEEWSRFDLLLRTATERFVFDDRVSVSQYVVASEKYMNAGSAGEFIAPNSMDTLLERQVVMFRNLYGKTHYTDTSPEVTTIIAYLTMVNQGPERQLPV